MVNCGSTLQEGAVLDDLQGLSHPFDTLNVTDKLLHELITRREHSLITFRGLRIFTDQDVSSPANKFNTRVSELHLRG